MNDPEFTIKVSSSVTGFVVAGALTGPHDRQYRSYPFGPDVITVDPVVRDTVDLLEKWLERWEWIARFEEGEHNTHRRQLLVPDTFRVLGSLLWQLVLKEEVGNALHRYRGLTEEAGQTLRVLFCFDASAESLARLPWEFLYRPDAPGSRGYFLGTETNLVLSRYMALQKGRATMRATKDKLRIVLWLILPDTDDYQDDRKACLGTLDTLRTQLKGIATIPDHIDGWHPEQVTAQLGAKADIVHVVGIYRCVDDEFKIMLPNGRYEPSRILVDSLVRTPTHRPELVVLHLCDWPESDTTENFERLAPLLVERGIPAVLAMRYPMQPGDADAFLTAFYEELVDSNDVGKAVQAARARSYVQGEQRRFGAPVLYLQSVGGSLLDKEPGNVAFARTRPAPRRGFGRPSAKPGPGPSRASLRRLRGSATSGKSSSTWWPSKHPTRKPAPRWSGGSRPRTGPQSRPRRS